ncbi:hypothetical protein [Streptomyces sp. NPDC089799]|uniref:hypothetical protein n=1 Tax=Streptomyces sp. NPDC089799 TaxID=3155066 RepID=UPI00343C7688
MSTATLTPNQGARPSGATALSESHPKHRLGSLLRAAKVFTASAFSVALLGEYGEEAGVIRR